MTHNARARTARAGFTLIELLVVLAIIAILVALTAAGVFALMSKGPEAVTRNDISQLVLAIEACKASLNPSGGKPLAFLPSSIELDENCNYPKRATPNTPDWFAVSFLQSAFGKSINLVPKGTTVNGITGTGIDWNGDGVIGGAGNPYTVVGEQALVFWLGGIPSAPTAAPGCLGFNSNPANPGYQVGATYRQTYFQFNSGRLVRGANNFLSYLDGYNTGQPYLYFSSYRAGNDYNPDTNILPPIPLISTVTNLPLPVYPYKDGSGKFINPNGYQVISAGKDGKFGWGSPPIPPAPMPTSPPFDYYFRGYGQNQPGSDDLANFSSAALSQPPQ
jgi:prepilin-type N-terminal cleavage/methylation domain-containing protein